MIRDISKKLLAATTLLGLGGLILSGCVQDYSPTKIIFTPKYETTALNCSTSFSHVNKKDGDSSKQQGWKYQQLQFFIHNIEVKTSQNDWQPWLMTTNAYQSKNVALLGEVCNEVNKQSNWELELSALTEVEDITDIRFTLGIPFSLNHLNPLTQSSPLNVSSMFWGWLGGHKFMRVELTSGNKDWLFHLGSTGCKALSPIRAPENECLQPNRVVISLPFTKKTTDIELDLSVLFRDLELTRNNSCQSSPDNENCKVLFENIGLDKSMSHEQLLFKAQIND
jgi:uncharacterized repeat protein (TIGR04052 family)